MNQNSVYLILGTNLGDRNKNLQRAIELVEKNCGPVKERSVVYATEAWGKKDQPDFLNQVLKIETPLSAEQLMQNILEIEKSMGRERKEKYGPRTIDIDILFYNHAIIDSDHLKIPHPEMQNRRFVLLPLAEIAANFQHPVLKKTIAQLLASCPDELNVNKI